MKNHHWLLKTGSAIFALAFAATALSAAPDGPDRQFAAISRLIEKADQAIEGGKSQEATQLYGATIAAYRDFAERFPDYQTELVRFRVTYCTNQLMGLLAVKQANAMPPAAEQTNEVARQVDQGIGFCRTGRFAEADALMRELVATHPSCAQAYLVQATAALGKGEPAEAKRLLERVLELAPAGMASAHYNMAQLIVREAAPDFEKAKTHYRLARELGAIADTDLESVLDL